MSWSLFRRAPKPDPDAMVFRRARYLGAGSLASRPELRAALRFVFDSRVKMPLELEIQWGEIGGWISASCALAGWESGPRALDPEQALDLELAFRRAEFWEAPVHDHAPLEADQYVLERREGERYHALFRATPDNDEPLGALLLELCRLGARALEEVALEGLAERALADAAQGAREPCPWGGCEHYRAPGDDVCLEHRVRLNRFARPRR